MSQNILITGCSGFLASHLIDAFHGQSVDRKNNENSSYRFFGMTEVTGFKSAEMEVHYVDLRDREKVFETVRAIRPQLTFHLAAIANVGFSWKNPQLTYEVNFVGSSNLLEAISEISPHSRVILMSSGELYGGNEGKPSGESTPIASPTNPYALSKVAMEMLGDLFALNKTKPLEIIKIRSFNFTGPGQAKQFVASDFSYQIAEIEKGLRPPHINVGNLTAERDISDVRDIANYLKVISEKGESRQVYNVCSGKVYSIEQLLDILLSFSMTKIEKVIDETKIRPVDTPRLHGDNSLIKEKFGLTPQYDIKQTLQDILNYWRQHIGAK